MPDRIMFLEGFEIEGADMVRFTWDKTFLAITMLFGLTGCLSATVEQLQARAAFDLSCGKERLQIVEIDERTRGVYGCGKKAVYVENCDRRDDCTWVLNSDGYPHK